MPVESIIAKRRSGGQPGNRNALKHGFYARQKPLPVLTLDSVRAALPGLFSTDPRYFVRENILLIEKIDSVLAILAPKMLLAENLKDTLTWFRPILKLVRSKQKVVRSLLLLENPRRTLFALSRKLLYYILLEFRERGLREYSITPPDDFDQFCASPSSTSSCNPAFFLPMEAGRLVPRVNFESTRFNQSNLPLMFPNPFLTDQQWIRIESSFFDFQAKLDSTRKRRRKKNDFPARLLFESIFIKFAFNLPWEKLSSLFHKIHPDLPPLSHRKCQSFYSALYNSGFLMGVYRQLYLHLLQYGDMPIEKKVLSGCFQMDDSTVFLASGQPLTWQNFTALLLLQRAYHNYRTIQRERKFL